MKTNHNLNTILFPPTIDSNCRDNNTFTYLSNSKELNRYHDVLISLYPISDPRLLPLTRHISNFIDSLWRNNGAKYTVEYLKECNRLFMWFVAGKPTTSDSDLRLGAPGGLPVIIPLAYRDLLRNKTDHRDYGNICRIIFALFGCYRLIKFPGTLKISSITDPSDSKGLNPWELGYVVSTKFQNIFSKTKDIEYSWDLLSLTTAGPNKSISLISAPFDALALRGSNILNGFRVLSDFFKLGTYNLLLKEFEILKDIKTTTEILSKLSIKEEPAGKRRVFAIVDIWTQSILKPIHDRVFSILKLIPQDGAFDQIKPVKALIAKGCKTTFCYDLSSATDRFPISIQVDVLSHLYNREVANAWKQVLVDRPYYLHETKQSYTYNTGQPMGALSSWGVFSLCHHVVVQLAATRVGILQWFTEYSLLGDDIVITNPVVAKEYFKIMTEELKVSINESKSLQSDIGVMEFAKRIIGPSGDYSPAGPKNISLLLANKLHLPSLLVDIREKGVSIDYFFVRKLLTTLKDKSIFRFNWNEIHALIWSLSEPFGFLKTYTLTPWKWRRSFESKKADKVMEDLCQFMKKEWSYQHDIAVTSIKDCLDRYKGFVKVGDHFIWSSSLPSLNEQRIKLMEEYFKISNLKYPTVYFNVEKPRMKSSYNMMETLWDNGGYIAPSFDTLYIELRDPETNKLISTRSFELVKLDYVFGQVFNYLTNSLPQISPRTSVFDNNNIKRKSLRHISFQFLKKFLKWSS